MTLILGMSKAEGIYMSVDYRITDSRSGKLVDDQSVKFLRDDYPPSESGPKVLFGFAGVANAPDGTPTGRWIRETLRGESDGFDTSMGHLRSRMNRDFGRIGAELVVCMLVIHGKHRYFGGLSNIRQDNDGPPVVVDEFGYHLEELSEPLAFMIGSGSGPVKASGDFALIDSQLRVMPRRPFDHMNLLAAINRRAASIEETVSPFCQASFVSEDDRWSPRSARFLEKGETAPFELPHLLFGADLTGMFVRFYEASTRWFDGVDPEFLPDLDGPPGELDRRP